MSLNRHKLPIIPPVKVRTGYDYDTPAVMEYDEVIFDYKTNRYLTLSQMRENEMLREELKQQKDKKKKRLEHIIGYYYKYR